MNPARFFKVHTLAALSAQCNEVDASLEELARVFLGRGRG